MEKDRFEKIYSQGILNSNAGGLTPLLDREGKPVITAVNR